jgi:hypothetical protein
MAPAPDGSPVDGAAEDELAGGLAALLVLLPLLQAERPRASVPAATTATRGRVRDMVVLL